MNRDKQENNKKIETRKGKTLNGDKTQIKESSMKIGVTLIFKENKPQAIKGVLKSLVLDTDKKDFNKNISNSAREIAKYYDYNYIGVNDIFAVSKNGIKEASLLGRTTFYDLDSIKKSKSLVSNDFSYNTSTKLNYFNCSLIYFCKTLKNEELTISVISLVNGNLENIVDKVISISEHPNLINDIKDNSLDEIKGLKFIGIEDICDIDLKFNVFQSFYLDFEDIENLNSEIASNKDIVEMIDDIFIP